MAICIAFFLQKVRNRKDVILKDDIYSGSFVKTNKN